MPGCTRLVCLDKLKGNCETHTSCLEPDSLTVAPLKDFRYERASVVCHRAATLCYRAAAVRESGSVSAEYCKWQIGGEAPPPIAVLPAEPMGPQSIGTAAPLLPATI